MKKFINFHQDIARKVPGISMGIAIIEGVKVSLGNDDVEQLKHEAISDLRSRFKLGNLLEDTNVKAYRNLYWTLGTDPTKIRPSSEALIRRILIQGGLSRINTIVDINNICSVKFGMPMGVYDREHIKGEIVVRFAEKGEKYKPIGNKHQFLNEGEIVVSDAEKILGVGYASSDSDYTKVSIDTKSVMLLVYGAPSINPSRVKEATEMTSRYVTTFCGGKLIRLETVVGE